MKVFGLTLLTGLLIFGADEADGQKLIVEITDIKNEKGKVGAALYSTKNDFMKNIYQTQVANARPGKVLLVFDNLPSGDYAISILHDLNDNGKMDTNFLGIPKDGYGFSNNVMGAFGPPGYDKAKFTHAAGDQTISIKMKYF